MKNPRNMIGPKVRQLRNKMELTQPQLAARCSRWGWDLSRETLAKIETQVRWVSDFELVCLANALQVTPEQLLPGKDRSSKLLPDYFRRLAFQIAD